MPKGYIEISLEALKSVLVLPEGYQIMAITPDIPRNVVQLLVESPAIPETLELPYITPIYQSMTDEQGQHWFRLSEIRTDRAFIHQEKERGKS